MRHWFLLIITLITSLTTFTVTITLDILNSSTMIEVHVYVWENPSAWLVIRIEEAFYNRTPQVAHEPHWNKPEADEWSGNPNHEEAQGSTEEAISKGQKTAKNNGKKRVGVVDSVIKNKFGELVRALRAMDCWWLGDHTWIGNLQIKKKKTQNLYLSLTHSLIRS